MRHFTNQEVRDWVQEKFGGSTVTNVRAWCRSEWQVPIGGYNMLGERLKEPVLYYEEDEFDVEYDVMPGVESHSLHLVVFNNELVVARDTLNIARPAWYLRTRVVDRG